MLILIYRIHIRLPSIFSVNLAFVPSPRLYESKSGIGTRRKFFLHQRCSCYLRKPRLPNAWKRLQHYWQGKCSLPQYSVFFALLNYFNILNRSLFQSWKNIFRPEGLSTRLHISLRFIIQVHFYQKIALFLKYSFLKLYRGFCAIQFRPDWKLEALWGFEFPGIQFD